MKSTLSREPKRKMDAKLQMFVNNRKSKSKKFTQPLRPQRSSIGLPQNAIQSHLSSKIPFNFYKKAAKGTSQKPIANFSTELLKKFKIYRTKVIFPFHANFKPFRPINLFFILSAIFK